MMDTITQLQVLTHLSASSIKNYLGCPLRFFFEKVLQLPRQPNLNQFLGKVVHEGLSLYNHAVWKRGTATLPELSDSIEAAFCTVEATDSIEWQTPEERNQLLSQANGIVGTYIEGEQKLKQPVPLGVEVLLTDIDLGFDYPFVGVLDLVRRGNVITDYKSIARTPSDLDLESWNHELQLTCYELLFEQATGESVSAKELIYLVKTKQPKVIRQNIKPADLIQRERFRNMVQTMVDGVENERFYPCPGMQCSWCDFRKECSQWKGGSL